MIIVAGSLRVDPDQRTSYLAGCAQVVQQARQAAGCLDFAISADLVEADRINVYERWESAAQLEDFRGSGPDTSQLEAIRSADVREYTVPTA